jgi:uncharacterized protein (TIGR02145 family)
MGRNLKWALSLFVFMLGFEGYSQTSDYLSYQAILRSSNGNTQANAMVSVRVSILDGGSTGDVLYIETHEVTTNENGLFSLAIGGGTTTGNYSGIDWSVGQKFLKVEVDSGAGYVLLGVQGMQSVPYSLSVKSTALRVSTAGDSLFIGSSFTIVPGISAANLPSDVVLDVDGNMYNKVTIGSQVWLAENLKSTHYCNGDPITLVTTSSWSTTTSSAYCTYSDDPTMAATYGHLYNWFAASDTRNVCPCGWHVPSDAEWTILAQTVDPATSTTCGPCNQSTLAGGVLKSTQFWTSPNTGGTDAVGFGALPGGDAISTGGYLNIGNQGYYWSSTSFSGSNAWYRRMSYTSSNFSKLNDSKQDGFSIRCLQD